MKSTIAPLAHSLQFTLPQRRRSWRLLLRNVNFFCKRFIDLAITGFALLLFVFVRQALRNAGGDAESASKLQKLRQHLRQAAGLRAG